MIKYNKINPLYAEILYDGVKVGTLENNINSYALEILYSRIVIGKDHKRLITPLANKLYLKIKKREKRKVLMSEKYFKTKREDYEIRD